MPNTYTSIAPKGPEANGVKMSEPLKNKLNKDNVNKINSHGDIEYHCVEYFFEREDIKSAVEWLKEKVKEEIKLYGIETIRLIDKAFEDVVE